MRTCPKCGIKNKNEATFCRECGEKLRTITCHKCGMEYSSDIKFCERCGEEVEIVITQPAPIEEKPIPKQGITIEFGYSGSRTLPLAIKQAQKYDTFLQRGVGKNAVYRVTFQRNQFKEIRDMIKCLDYMKNREVYVDSEKKKWGNVFSYCYKGKLDSRDPEKYCFGGVHNERQNIFGCHGMYFYFDNELFIDDRYYFWLFGKFEEIGDFVFDKAKIRQKVETELDQVRDCPALNIQFVMDVLEAFPNVVNPRLDKNWAYKDERDRIIEEVVFRNGKMFSVEKYEEDEAEILGVVPRSIEAAKSIFEEIKTRVKQKYEKKI
jgi:hypothetical protein